jgi:hypothetical protein
MTDLDEATLTNQQAMRQAAPRWTLDGQAVRRQTAMQDPCASAGVERELRRKHAGHAKPRQIPLQLSSRLWMTGVIASNA